MRMPTCEIFVVVLLLHLPASVISDVFLPTRTIHTADAPNVLRALTMRAYEIANAEAHTDSAEDERLVDRHILQIDQCLFVVALSRVTPAAQDLMRIAGMHVLSSVPDRAFLVLAKRSVVSAVLLSGPSFVWAGKLLGSDKLDCQLLIDLSKEAEHQRNTDTPKLLHLIVTFAAFDEQLPLTSLMPHKHQEALNGFGELMQGLSDIAKRDSMSIEQISLYSKLDWQVLVTLPDNMPIREKLKTLHWLSEFCEISKITSAESTALVRSTHYLRLQPGGSNAMLLGR